MPELCPLNYFITLFEFIATNHKQINHSSKEKHFFRLEVEEVLTGLGDSVNYPYLAMENYEYGFTDSLSDNVLKNRQCAFMVLDHIISADDSDAIHQAFDKCESIVDDILNLLQQFANSRQHPVVKDFDINSVEVVPIYNQADQAYGMRAMFKTVNNYKSSVDISKWKTIDYGS